MAYYTTLLLNVAWALLIFKEKQVYCGVVTGNVAR
jgi:tryptophan-rich sensory protein